MIALLDNLARVGMGLGIFAIFQPWWEGGLRLGFILTLVFTVLHIITSHLVVPDKKD